MSFVQKLKEQAKANLEEKIDILTRPRFFDEPDSDYDEEDETTIRMVKQKRKLDELYDRAPHYMTITHNKEYTEYIKPLLTATPNDIEEVTTIPHDSDNIEAIKDYKGIYSDKKDSFTFRGNKQCLYFRLKDDTKRRMIRRYTKEHLNEVAQIVQEETEKIFQEGKASFDATVSKLSDQKVTEDTPKSDTSSEIKCQHGANWNICRACNEHGYADQYKSVQEIITDIKSKYHQATLDDCV